MTKTNSILLKTLLIALGFSAAVLPDISKADLVVEKIECDGNSQTECVRWERNPYGYYYCIQIFNPCESDTIPVQSLPSE